MLAEIREFIIGLSHKIDDLLLRPSVKEKRKLVAKRTIEKEMRLSNDLSRTEAKQTKKEHISGQRQPIAMQTQQSFQPHPPHKQQASVGVWSGVKIGCGMFIVLPIILFLVVFIGLAILAWPSIKKQREKTKQRTEDVSHALTDKENTILLNADTDGNGVVTREEYLAAKEAIEKKENP